MTTTDELLEQLMLAGHFQAAGALLEEQGNHVHASEVYAQGNLSSLALCAAAAAGDAGLAQRVILHTAEGDVHNLAETLKLRNQFHAASKLFEFLGRYREAIDVAQKDKNWGWAADLRENYLEMDSPTSMWVVGNSAENAGQLERAIKMYRRAGDCQNQLAGVLRKLPKFKESCRLGSEAFAAGDFETAKAHYNSLLQRYSGHIPTRWHLGIIGHVLGNDDDAALHLAKAARFDAQALGGLPHIVQAYVQSFTDGEQRSRREGLMQQLYLLTAEMVADEYTHAEGVVFRGQLEGITGKGPIGSRRVFKKMLKEDPSNLGAHFGIASAWEATAKERSGDGKAKAYRSAIARYEQVLRDVDSENVDALCYIGMRRLDLRENGAARKRFEKVLSLRRNHWIAASGMQGVSVRWYGQAVPLYNKVGKRRDALALLEKVLECDPHCADAYRLKGMALQKLGKKEEAITSYRAALKRGNVFWERTAKKRTEDVMSRLEKMGEHVFRW